MLPFQQHMLDEKVARRWSVGLLAGIVTALLLFFFYVVLPLISPLD
jgi:hypothetical protein